MVATVEAMEAVMEAVMAVVMAVVRVVATAETTGVEKGAGRGRDGARRSGWPVVRRAAQRMDARSVVRRSGRGTRSEAAARAKMGGGVAAVAARHPVDVRLVEHGVQVFLRVGVPRLGRHKPQQRDELLAVERAVALRRARRAGGHGERTRPRAVRPP